MTDFNDTPKNVTNNVEVAELAQDAITLAKPISGRVVLEAQDSATYAVSFDPNEANLSLSGSDLVFTFSDGSELVLSDFAQSAPLPTIMLSDGTILAGDVVVAQLQDPASDVFNLETAAGPGGAGGGQFNYDDNFGDNVDLIDNLPPIPFTNLITVAAEIEDFDPDLPLAAVNGLPDAENEVVIFDETGGVGESISGVLDFDFGADGGGMVMGTGDFSSNGSQTAGTLSSGGEPVTVTFDAATGVYTGVDASGETIFTLTINADGSYVFDLAQPLDHADGSNPNDIINLNFDYKVVDADGDITTATVTILVADDGPSAPLVTFNQVDETTDLSQTLSGDLNIDFGEDGAGSIQATDNFGATGSLTAGVLSSGGEPVTVELSGNTYTGTTPDGTVIFTMTINADGTYDFNLLEPLDHADGDNPNDVINLGFTYQVTDGDGDSVESTIVIQVADDAPLAADDSQTLASDQLVVNGNVVDNDDYGEDGAGNLTQITFEGQTLSFAVDGQTDASGNTFIEVDGEYGTLVIFENGSYTYTIDPDAIANATGTPPFIDDFDYTIVDADGDTSTATLTIDASDVIVNLGDPTASDEAIALDETDGLSQTLSGELDFDFGPDGGGMVMGTGVFGADGSVPAGGLTSGGEAVTVTFDADTGVYTGATAGGETVFTLIINADGTYTFDLLGTLDHADGSNPNDIIDLNFEYKVVDADGDITTATITVAVADDGPMSVDIDGGILDETDGFSQTLNGTIDGFDFGEDGEGSFGANGDFDADGSLLGGTLTSGGEDVTVTFDTDTGVYTGTTAGGETVFTMTINADGSYEFELLGTLDHGNPNDPNDIIDLNFGYEVVDGDGDVTTSTVTVQVADDGPQATGFTIAIDEAGVLPNTLESSINIGFPPTPGNDGGGNVELNGNILVRANGEFIDLADVTTNGGEPVFVTYLGDGVWVGGTTDGASDIFEMVFNADGTYTFTLNGTLDHFDDMASNSDDHIQFLFGYTITDSEGDADSNYITIQIDDDAPVAVDDFRTVTDDAPIATGNVITDSDHISNDGANLLTQITFEGQTLSFAVDGQTDSNGNTFIEVDGEYGTLVIFEDGSYTYTANNEPRDGDAPFIDEFDYTVIDVDGDTSDATLIIDATAITINLGDPTASDESVVLDETDGLSQTLSGELDFDFGADGGGMVMGTGDFNADGSLPATGLMSGGETVTVTFDADTGVYTGATAGGETVFTLVINADGSYTFDLIGALDHADSSNPDDIINLNFDYKVVDADGDITTATITVAVADDGPQAIDITAGVLDETGGFPQTLNDTIDVDFGEDGAGSIGGNGDFGAGGSLLGGTLTSGGETVTVTFDAGTGTYTGTIPGGTGAGQAVFTLTINANGSYNFELLGTLDHADGDNPNDVINLNFGYDIVDGDGDTAAATITIQVLDDTLQTIDDVLGSLDESNTPQTGGGQTLEGVVSSVDFGEDGIGSIEHNSDFGASGSLLNGVLTSGGDEVTVTSSGSTYVGTTPDGTVIFTMTLNSDGTYTFELLGTLDHADGADANDVITLDFGYLFFDGDGDEAEGIVSVNIVDDAPVAADTTALLDETDGLSQTLEGVVDTADFGADGAGSIEGNGEFNFASVDFTDTLTSGGETVTVTFDADTGMYTGTIPGGTGAGQTVFTLTINADGSYNFELLLPIDHPNTGNSNEGIGLQFGYTVTDADGDTSEALIRIAVLDDGPTIDNAASASVDETGGATGSFPQTVDGDAASIVDFGTDGFGSLEGNGNFEFASAGGVPLTSGGEDVTVTYNAASGTYTGVTAGGETIFTMTINADGTYNFELLGPIDHPDGTNSNDGVGLRFGFTATDGDGDSVESTINIAVFDDGPEVDTDATGSVDETDGFPQAVTGDVDVDFGADGAGSLEGNGGFEFVSASGAPLTSGGESVTVTYDATSGTYTGVTAAGIVIFTMMLNSDGSYAFELQGPIDHPDGTNPNDGVGLRFGYTATDGDGDSVDGLIRIAVFDDAPVAEDDTNTFEGTSTSGNVITGDGADDPSDSADDFGADGPGGVTQVEFDGNIVTFGDDAQVDADGNLFIEIEGDFGTLILYENGDYTYNLNQIGDTTTTFGIDSSDVVGDPVSISDNGITISTGTGDHLTFLDTGQFGSGIGIDSNLHNSDKIFNGESIIVSFDNPAEQVELSVADIGPNDGSDSIGLKVFFGSGVNDFMIVEWVLPNPTPANGIVDFTLNADALGLDSIYSVEMFTGNMYGLHCDAAFLLNDVTATYSNAVGGVDEFEYTIVDADGDTSSATLTFDAIDPNGFAPGDNGGDAESTVANVDGDLVLTDLDVLPDNELLNLSDLTEYPDITQSDITRFDDYQLPEFTGDGNPLSNLTGHPDITVSDWAENAPDPLLMLDSGSSEESASSVFYDPSANALDISELLSDSGYEPGVSDIGHFIQVEESGEVHVDVTGTGNFDESNVVGIVDGISAFDTIDVVLNDDEGNIPVQIV